MTSAAYDRRTVGLAGVVVLALGLHLFMLVGMTVTAVNQASATATIAAADSQDASQPVPSEHGRQHIMTGCMALFTALGLGVLVTRVGRAVSVLAAEGSVERCWRGVQVTAADLPLPSGTLFDTGVLLRV